MTHEEAVRADKLLPAQVRASVEDDMPDVLLLMSKVKDARERLKQRGERYQKLSVTRKLSPKRDIHRIDWKELHSPVQANDVVPRPTSKFLSSLSLPGDEEDAEFEDEDIDDVELDRARTEYGANQFVDEDIAREKFKKPQRFWITRILSIAILIMLVMVVTFLCIRLYSGEKSIRGPETDESLSSLPVTPIPVTPAPSTDPPITPHLHLPHPLPKDLQLPHPLPKHLRLSHPFPLCILLVFPILHPRHIQILFLPLPLQWPHLSRQHRLL